MACYLGYGKYLDMRVMSSMYIYIKPQEKFCSEDVCVQRVHQP